MLHKSTLALAGLAYACQLTAGTPPQPMLAAGNESNWDAYAKALARGVSAGTSARQTPDWLKTGYIYQIQPRAFTHEGTIKAATRKLPLVKDAGATVVYLMPVNVLDDETEHLGAIARQFKQPKGFYRTKDYFNTDPEFGTNEDRREFVRQAHRLGMKVIFDIVFFHCGHSAELIKKNPNWVERNPDGSIKIGKWSYPVLNFREAGLREYLYTVLTYLVADVDVDGFRCDVAETQPLDFWVEARRRVSAIKPDAVLICEGFGCPGEQEYAFDACYDWPSKNAIRKSLDGQKPVSDIVRAWHEKHDNCEKGSRFLRFVENHDETDMSQKGKGPRGDSDERWGRELMEAALFYCFTADGIPFLFNGNEFADRTPQRMIIWTPIDWYGRDTPEGVRRLSFVRKFAALRKTDPAFSTDARLDWVTNSCPDAVLTYRKTSVDGSSKWLCAVNFRKVPVTVEIPGRTPFSLAPAEWKMIDEKDPWALGVNPYDFVVYDPKMPLKYEECKPTDFGDRYNCHFQVIYDANRKAYFAFWTQATKETATDMHIAFSKSTDLKAGWTQPVVLGGNERRSESRPMAYWQQPMLSAKGRLYCLWNQQVGTNRCHYGIMRGRYSDDAGEHWSPAEDAAAWPTNVLRHWKMPAGAPHWCIWQRPLRFGPDGSFFVGVTHGSCRVGFLNYTNIDSNPEIPDIGFRFFHATSDTYLKVPKGLGSSCCEEASIVKLPDGRLFALLRSRTGHPLWTQSRDGGCTWQALRPLEKPNGEKFLHCCSPCPLYDWKGCEAGSGTYFALIHNTYDFKKKNQPRGPLYLIAGTFDPRGEQPVRFSEPKLFAPRQNGNAFYASYTVDENGVGILWFCDMKRWLLGRKIGSEWFSQFSSHDVRL